MSTLPSPAPGSRLQRMAAWHRAIFFIGLWVAYLVVLHGTAAHTYGFFRMLGLACTSAIELASVWIACLVLRRRIRPGRRIAEIGYLAVPLLTVAVYAAQMYALHLSGNFITALAIENRAEAWIVRGDHAVAAFAFALGWWLLFALGYGYGKRTSDMRAAPPMRLPRRILAAAFVAAALWLLVSQRDTGLLQVGHRQAPLIAMANAVGEIVADRFASDGEAAMPDAKTRYPLEKAWIYRDNLPFPSTGRADGRPNVIVIFLEGTSTRLIDAYGGTYPDLTPNMDRFARQSMRVVDYYNHTAATYRGLTGQLASGYPQAGGSDDDVAAVGRSQAQTPVPHTDYLTVPMLLRDHGYGTFFLSPHHDTVGLNAMLRALGFGKVFSFDDVARNIAPGNPLYYVEGALSDDDMFHALQVLMTRGTLSMDGKPFFIGLYTFGTHAFLDIMPDGTRYGDGSNPALNKLHNADRAFGRFLDYFLASPYANDTILVLTADHATYPDPAYRAVAGSNFRPYFVDTIPLLIRDPTHRLPAAYDARDRTSVDLAPTLMQLLGMRRGDNSFVGTSLFEQATQPVGFTAIGDEFFVTDAQGVHPAAEVPPADRAAFQSWKKHGCSTTTGWNGRTASRRRGAPRWQAARARRRRHLRRATPYGHGNGHACNASRPAQPDRGDGAIRHGVARLKPRMATLQAGCASA